MYQVPGGDGSRVTAAGHGHLHVTRLPPSKLTIQDITFSYPLKLIAPTCPPELNCQLVFLLSYGGGLVAGDGIDLTVKVDKEARLAIATQGSTKIYEARKPDQWTYQRMHCTLAGKTGLALLPDPIQPFRDSRFRQQQIFKYAHDADLAVLDWVSEGRSANGEHWDFHQFTSLNEFWLEAEDPSTKPRLMLRDHLILGDSQNAGLDAAQSVRHQMQGAGIFATMFVRGPGMVKLKAFFVEEFRLLPRIGQRRWVPPPPEIAPVKSSDELWREARHAYEQEHSILWTAALHRGFAVVKLSARAPEGARRWIHDMLIHDGSIENVFGPQSICCLKY